MAGKKKNPILFWYTPRGSTVMAGEKASLVKLTLYLAKEGLMMTHHTRLVVYDIDRYLKNSKEKDLKYFVGGLDQNGAAIGDPFKPPLDKRFIDPDIDQQKGVLFKTDLVLQRKDDKAIRTKDHRAKLWIGHWYVKQSISPKTLSPPSKYRLKLMMHGKCKDGQWDQGDLTWVHIGTVDLGQHPGQNIRLVFRFINIGPTINKIQKNSVLATNIHPSHINSWRARLETNYFTVKLRRATGSRRPGTKAPTPAKPSPASSAAKRAIVPDLTGRYEQRPKDFQSDFKEVSPSTIWINHIGSAIVGWYTPTRVICPSSSEINAPFTWHFCFVVEEWLGSGKMSPLRWIENKNGSSPWKEKQSDPDFFAYDLLNIAKVLVSKRAIGFQMSRYNLGTVRFHNKHRDIKLWLQTDNGPQTAYFHKVLPRSRLPWSIIPKMPAKWGSVNIRERIITADMEPLPEGVSWHVTQKLSVRNSEFVEAIKKFHKHKTSSTAASQAEPAGQATGKILSNLVNSFKEKYRPELISIIGHIARCNIIVAEKKKKGAKAHCAKCKKLCPPGTACAIVWMEEMVGWKMAQPLTPKSKNEKEQYEKQITNNGGWKGFARAGIASGGRFTYEFSFYKASVSGKLLIGGSLGGFKVFISKKAINAVDRSKEWKTKLEAWGIFLGLSAGLQFGFKAGFGGSGGGGDPPDIKIDSYWDLEQADFDHARFRVAGCTIGGVDIPFSGGKALDSAYFELTLPGGNYRLSGVVVDTFKWGVNQPALNEIEDEAKKFTDIKAAVEIKIYSQTMSWGIFLDTDPAKTEVKPPDKKKPPAKKKVELVVSRPVMMFATGESIIDPNLLLFLDAMLANFRRLLEIPGWYHCIGFSSPDWMANRNNPQLVKEQNLILSESRAKAVLARIDEVVLRPIRIIPKKDLKYSGTIGFGRGPSLMPLSEHGGGLQDPLTATDKKRLLEEKHNKYHLWQRVDVLINGVVVVSIKGK